MTPEEMPRYFWCEDGFICDRSEPDAESVITHSDEPLYAEVDPVERLNDQDSRLATVTAERDRLLDAVNWACGGAGSDFGREMPASGPRYWWRRVLAKKAGLVYNRATHRYDAAQKEAPDGR